ncbi:MAG: class I SAM-dependent methyltransferase, partial [Pseudobdellovibrionaceae bacterium]
DTMLKMAEERRNSMGITNFQLFLLDRPVLPIKNNFFDAVLSSFAIEYSTHLDEDVKELHRVLKPGGLFVISLWQDCEERNPFQALIPKTIREVSYETSLSHDIFFKFSKDDFLEKKMLSLGFTQINHEIFEGHFSYDSVDEFWNLKKMASPAVMKDMGLLTARQGLEVQEKIEKFFVCNKSDSQKEYELPFSAHIYVYKKDFL